MASTDHHDEIEAVPGTVHLVDIESKLDGPHGAGQERDIILVPAPSNHPDDPLNWSVVRKRVTATCMAL